MPWFAQLVGAGARVLTGLADLVLPAECGGCSTPGAGLCPECLAVLRAEPHAARPTPAPPGLPPCLAVGEYAGALRELILAYKERGRRGLAAHLGGALASAVAAGWPVPGPVALVPIPATAAAIRARHGDHMLRLAGHTRRALLSARVPAFVVSPLRARPRPDSAHLDRYARARAARTAFVPSRDAAAWRLLCETADTGAVVLLDDVLTTGSTLAAAAGCLVEKGVATTFAVTLAVTRLRGRHASLADGDDVDGWKS